MKHLYYLESAKSVNIGDNGVCVPIPAKTLKWKVRLPKVAWEDPELCLRERLEVMPDLKYHIVRVVQAGWFKTILIRVSTWFSDDWVMNH
jgi:hypothetical protein